MSTFFHVNEEVLRQLREKANATQTKQKTNDTSPDSLGFSYHKDGAIVIDNSLLTKIISHGEEELSTEEYKKVSVWVPSSGWVPIR